LGVILFRVTGSEHVGLRTGSSEHMPILYTTGNRKGFFDFEEYIIKFEIKDFPRMAVICHHVVATRENCSEEFIACKASIIAYTMETNEKT